MEWNQFRCAISTCHVGSSLRRSLIAVIGKFFKCLQSSDVPVAIDLNILLVMSVGVISALYAGRDTSKVYQGGRKQSANKFQVAESTITINV